jgi:hypothetical protein
MNNENDLVYSQHAVEFVAVATEYCRYAEHAAEFRGEDLLNIMQRFLPLLYLKASFLPKLKPVFDDGNEKFVNESDWNIVHDAFKRKFGTANDYIDVPDEKISGSEELVLSSLAENMADIYQDLKDFSLLYQTGTSEVMNDALWECRENFENIWGQKLVNSLRAIHKFLYSGESLSEKEDDINDKKDKRDKSEWFISKRQKEFTDDDDE